MKDYDVTVTLTFKKSMRIKAECGDKAMDMASDILLNTDLIELTEDDIESVSCEAERLKEKPCENCDEDAEYTCPYEEREYLFDELY